jgi:hypothetical protein
VVSLLLSDQVLPEGLMVVVMLCLHHHAMNVVKNVAVLEGE